MKVIKGLFFSAIVFMALVGASIFLLGVVPAQANVQAGLKRLSPDDLTPWTPPAPAWRIAVETDGLYQMTYDDLAAAGLPVDSLDPRTFRMFYLGQEIPIEVEGEEDGRFDAGDAVLFYGRDVDSLFYEGLLPTNRYTGTSIYWLSFGQGNGARMSLKPGLSTGETPAAFRHHLHLEDNTRYLSAYPFREGADHWYWEWIRAQGVNASGSREHDFDVQNLASGDYTATLTLTILGYTDGQHHLVLYINDVQVFDDATSWADYNIFTATAVFSQSLLQNGANVVKVEIQNDDDRGYDEAYLNWIEIDYFDGFVAENDALEFGGLITGTQRFQIEGFQANDVRAYEVSDYLRPQRISGVVIEGGGPYTATFGDDVTPDSRYLALTPAARLKPARIEAVTPLTSTYTPADLADAANGADYILITHRDFWEDALRLAEHRADDYRVSLVDVQQIYDQFNGGMMSAEAIHDFLAYAYSNWTQPAPQFVTLMGDGTYDMRGYGNTSGTFIPPYLALVDPTLGETASENRFVTLGGDDPLPDMAIGRLTANTPDEARAMVDKIINYESGCRCGSWNYNAFFMSDNLEGGGGNFYALSDAVADGYADPPTNTVKFLPDVYSPTKFYMGQTCDISNPTIADECPSQLSASLDMTGSLFVSYVGHATKIYWAKEHLWDQMDVAGLTNGPCLPIMLSMTCFDGSFQEPARDALGEYQVRIPEHGAIASWSSTGNGLANGHDLLEKGLMLALFHQDITRLGPAIDYAKRYLWDESGDQYLDLIETYVLLGDSALEPKTDAVCRDTPTAVVLSDLGASSLPGAVRLSWRTLDESTLLAFNVQRRDEGSTGAFVTVNDRPLFARGAPGLYRYDDRALEPDVRYEYRLQILQLDGDVTWQSLGVAGPRSNPVIFSSPIH